MTATVRANTANFIGFFTNTPKIFLGSFLGSFLCVQRNKQQDFCRNNGITKNIFAKKARVLPDFFSPTPCLHRSHFLPKNADFWDR